MKDLWCGTPLHLQGALGLWVAEVLGQRCLSVTFDFIITLDSQQSQFEMTLLQLFFGCCSCLGAPPDQDAQLCSVLILPEAQSLPALNHK